MAAPRQCNGGGSLAAAAAWWWQFGSRGGSSAAVAACCGSSSAAGEGTEKHTDSYIRSNYQGRQPQTEKILSFCGPVGYSVGNF
jgi:hypothetical protein